MVGMGVIGYINTPKGLRPHKVVWANHIADIAKNRFYKSRYDPANEEKQKKNAFTKYETMIN